MLYVENALILSNEEILNSCFKMKLMAPKISENAKAGQFIELSCGQVNYAPLLKRPISIHNVKENIVEIIYYVVGVGTDLLSKKQKGDFVEIVGPLGNGFNIENSKNHILVGGGYGVPPMYFLAKTLKEAGKNVFVCIGAKNKELILCQEDFLELGICLCVATDDGSLGIKGFVTESVKTILENNKLKASVYACGPTIMMKNLYNLCKDYDNVENINCSMENIMACGVGVCNGCVLEIKDGDSWTYKRVCKDGPVFKGDSIVW